MTDTRPASLGSTLKWAATSSGLFIACALWGAYSCAHGGFGLLVMSILPLFVIVPIVMVPVALLFMPWRASRIAAQQMLLLGLVWLCAGVVGVAAEKPIRRLVFEGVAEDAEALVNALHRYQRERGQPVAELELLVPDYLSHVPDTGLTGFPNFGYSPDPATNTWRLAIQVSSGIMNWDVFMYESTEVYPERTRVGWVEPMGRWAYVHE